MVKEFKTPGVFIEETNAFPSSVVEVASAVPAFVGSTETASHKGSSLRGKPWRISSTAEYAQFFGGLPKPRVRFEEMPAGTSEPPLDMEQARNPTLVFSHGGRSYRLSRPAAQSHLLPLAMRHFFENGGGACHVVSVGGLDGQITEAALTAGLAPLRGEPEPTLLVVPDAVRLPRAGCTAVQAAMLAHCGAEATNRFALLDVWGGDRPRDDLAGDCIERFRRDLAPGHRSHGAAYFPWLHTTILKASELDASLLDNREDLPALLKQQLALPAKATDDLPAKTRALIELIDDLGRSDGALGDKLHAAIQARLRLGAPQPMLVMPVPVPPPKDGTEFDRYRADYQRAAHQAALKMSPLYATLVERTRELLNMLPPSAAMAGVITTIDRTRGMWATPANVSLNAVTAPTVSITNEQQDELNITAQGMSINAIRSFVGKGVLVWGARTLDGNSNEWRYISVRRTVDVVAESCRLALQAYVFEPNDARTWTAVRSMLDSYLMRLWQRGGLMGATPDEAFAVQCMLGQTMTAQDVLDGRLRVSVLLAIVQPAEFVVLTLEERLQAGEP